MLLVGAGVALFATVAYLFTVLRQAGLDLAMFDEPDRLLVWVSGHGRQYQGMWLLYLLSQALLLCVPWLLAEQYAARAVAVLGTASVVIAMTGLATLYAAGPVTAEAYQAALAGNGSPPAVLAMHTLVADIGKDLRLFSEALLGAWLVLMGHRLARGAGGRAWWLLVALGAWSTMVAVWKLLDPTMPLEDWLGFLLGTGYLGFGAALIWLAAGPGTRPGKRPTADTTPAAAT